jgi:pyruvate formate lyase activating enzyme
VRECPQNALTLTDSGVVIDREKCVVCGACARVCEADAIKISGETKTLEEVWKIIRKDLVYYETSGGGVTCSGGEILTQADFVRAIFEKCRAEGVHTCADTSGFGTGEAMAKVLEFANLVYFDLKHANPARHLALTGVPLETVLTNLRLAAESPTEVTIRIPLIPEHNNSPETLAEMARLIRENAPNAAVSLLPYHRYGENKYAAVGMTYPLSGLRENTAEELAAAERIFAQAGFAVSVSK